MSSSTFGRHVRSSRLSTQNAAAHRPVACAGSKKCEQFKPQLEKVAAVSEFAESIKHARSDISDKRGYTSYLEKFGITRLPTLVLFRNSHPEMYSHDAPLSYDGVVRWLKTQTVSSRLKPEKPPLASAP